MAEVHDQMLIQHKYGNPSAQLHLIFSNRGGREVRVKKVTLAFQDRHGNAFSLPASTYLQQQRDASGVIFVPFTLKASEEWGHIVLFWPPLTRQVDLSIRRAKVALREDLAAKRAANPDPAIWVAADDHNIAPFIELFNKQFKWFADDYEVTLQAETEPPNAMKPQKFRVVIFDPDTELLREPTKRYKYGEDILPGSPAPEGAFVQVTPM